MKKQLLFGLLLCCLVVGQTFGQKKDEKTELSKEEKAKLAAETKDWKKKLKALDPLAYRDIVTKLKNLRDENAGLQGMLRTVGKELPNKDEEIAKLQAEIDSLESLLKPKNKTSESEYSTAMNAEYAQGVWYRVQVGVKNKIDISELGEDNKNLNVETDSDNRHKYTLGHFKDYWEAEEFKKAMRVVMGLNRKPEQSREMWVVVYENNERKNLKDFLMLSGAAKGGN